MKAGTLNHIKTKRLMKSLKLPLFQAIGVLETLWAVTVDCAWDGNIGRFTNEEIADSIGWQKDHDALVAALVNAGWVDENGLDAFDQSCRLAIHDWKEHCPEYIKKRINRDDRTKNKDLSSVLADNGSHDPTGVCHDPTGGRQDETPVGHFQTGGALTNTNPTKSNQSKTNQGESASRKWSGAFSKLVRQDLAHDDRLHERYRRAVALGAVEDTQAGLLNFLGAAERALEVADDPPAMFRKIVEERLYGHITQAQEDRANARLKRLRKGRNGETSEAVKRLGQSIRAGPADHPAAEP